MEDPDIDARLRSGGWMVNLGILLLVGAVMGTCMVAMGSANDPNPRLRGFELGQSPWLLLSITGGIALIVLGLVKKSNARRDAEQRFRDQHTTIDVVPDADVPGGPFRGAVKHVPVLDPTIQAIEDAQRSRDHSRGSTYLVIGGLILAATLVGIMMGMSGNGESMHRRAEAVLTSVGLGVFPFGLGLFFAIKGLLLRSR